MDLTCYRCKETKPESEFDLRHDRSKGYRKSCRACEDPNGTKRCGQCAEIKSKTEFHRSNAKSGRNYWQGECKDCQRGNMRKWRLAHQYGMTVADYNAMLEKQLGTCAICWLPPEEGKLLAVDHDHMCCPGEKTCGKCVRGLLCADCNRGLGMFKDSPIVLARASRYVNRT